MPKLKKVKDVSVFYIADARNGKNSTFRTKSGAENFLKKNKGGKIILHKK